MKNRGFFLFLLIVGSIALLGKEDERRQEPIPVPNVQQTKSADKSAEKSAQLASRSSNTGDLKSANNATQVQLFAQMSPRYLFAQVNRLNIREAPGAHTKSLGSVGVGTRFRVHDSRGSWVRVSNDELGLSGWVSRNYLGISKGTEPKAALPIKQTAKPARAVPKPQIIAPKITETVALDDVVQRIIENSIASYPGRCPCPYNRDRAGRQCGGRSAYNRAGGYAPICFRQDVTAEMINKYKNVE